MNPKMSPENIANTDAEFLIKLQSLIEEVYGPRETPFEDGLVMQTLLASVARLEATILIGIGSASIEEGRELLGTSDAESKHWREEIYQVSLQQCFEMILKKAREVYPNFPEREGKKESMPTPVNTQNFAS